MGSSPEGGGAVMVLPCDSVGSRPGARTATRRERILLGRAAPKHREDSPSSTHHFVSVNWSRRWRSRRTTRSGSPSSRSCGRACSRAGCARPPGSTTSCATTVYWVALLRFIGCTGHAHEVATLFGDEIAIRGQTLVHDSGNPAEVMRDIDGLRDRRPRARRSGTRSSGRSRRRSASGRSYNFSSGCEVADVLVAEAGLRPGRPRGAPVHVRVLERERATPTTSKGEAIPLPMRIVHVSHDMEAIGRLFSPERALEAAHERRGETYDPAVADLFLAHGRDWFDRLARDRAVGRRARPRARASPAPDGRASSTTPSPSSPTSSTSSRRTGAGTAAAARSSRRTRPACWGSPTRR